MLEGKNLLLGPLRPLSLLSFYLFSTLLLFALPPKDAVLDLLQFRGHLVGEFVKDLPIEPDASLFHPEQDI